MLKLKPTYDINALSDTVKAQIGSAIINKLAQVVILEVVNENTADVKAYRQTKGEYIYEL